MARVVTFSTGGVLSGRGLSCAQTIGLRTVTIVNPTVLAINFLTTCLLYQFLSGSVIPNTD